MKQFFGLILLFAVINSCKKADIVPMQACNYNASESNAVHPADAKLQAILREYTEKGLPGIVLKIRDQHGVWTGSAGYADLAGKIPMKPCVTSKVASITKMLVGTLTMKLWERGKLNLDDKAASYLNDEIVDRVVNLNKVTIRQLMNHTTGIPAPTAQSAFYLAVLNNPDKRWKSEEVIRYVYDLPETFCCGSDRASYSDANTLLLGLVLDRILGEHHSLALKREVLDVLGMNDTYYYPNQELPLYTARGYFDLYNNGTITDVTNINTGSGNGYGGTYATADDIFKYMEETWRKGTFLSDSARAEMMRWVPESVGDRTANDTLFLGQCLMKRFTYLKQGSYGIGHTGRDLGYNATAVWFPKEDVTVMMLVNYGTNGSSDLKPVFMDFQDAVLKTFIHD